MVPPRRVIAGVVDDLWLQAHMSTLPAGHFGDFVGILAFILSTTDSQKSSAVRSVGGGCLHANRNHSRRDEERT